MHGVVEISGWILLHDINLVRVTTDTVKCHYKQPARNAGFSLK
jgi:hypothetical protein